jgi:dGTPase
MARLFGYFLEHPGEISPGSRKRIGKNGLHRAVCDHIASMTDRYVMREYDRIFGTKTDAI